MATYSFNEMGGIEIDFAGVKPSAEIRTKLKSVKYRWNPSKMIWWAYKTDEAVDMAKKNLWRRCRNSGRSCECTSSNK